MGHLPGNFTVACLERAARIGGREVDAALAHLGVSDPDDRKAARALVSSPDVTFCAAVDNRGDDVIWLVPQAIDGVHRAGLVDADGRLRHIRIVAV